MQVVLSQRLSNIEKRNNNNKKEHIHCRPKFFIKCGLSGAKQC
jgi:hypothetical protein